MKNEYSDWVIGWPKPLWMWLFYEVKCLLVTQLDVVIHWLWNCIFLSINEKKKRAINIPAENLKVAAQSNINANFFPNNL